MAGYFRKISGSVRKSTLRLVGDIERVTFSKGHTQESANTPPLPAVTDLPTYAARSQEKSSCTLENLGYIYI